MIYVALCILFTVIGQLSLKLGMLEVGALPQPMTPPTVIRYLFGAFLHWKVFLGFVSALFASFAWMAALSRLELSIAYPFMGLAIVLVLALSPTILDEPQTWSRWAGVGLVCTGLWVAAR